MSATSQPLMDRYWPNFNDRFLGPSLTNANCDGDIWQGGICPGDIDVYKLRISQLILTWFLPNFLNPCFWGPKFLGTQTFLNQTFFWLPILFLPKIFLTKKGHGNCYQSFKIYIIIQAITYLSTKMFISLIAYFCSLFLDQNFFLTQVFFWPKFFGHVFLDQIFLYLKILDPKQFFGPKVL